MLLQQFADQPSILVVDDNPLIVNIVKSLLQSEHYQVHVASHGKEALELLERKPVDVIVCDVMMPVMDGYELHQLVRARPNLTHVPFIFLTALSDSVDINHGKEMGADDYITKPFEPKDLLSIVKGKVARSKTLKQSTEQRFDAYRKKVVHVLSHEFRTPLVAINTGTEILIEDNGALEPSKVRGLLEAIARGGQRLERLVTDFMLLQQIEAGVAQRLFATRAVVCNPTNLVREFFDSKRDGLEAEGFTATFSSECPNARVKVYEPHLIDVLNRLVSNVRKFKSNRLSLEIGVLQRDRRVVIEVRDRGTGMNTERVCEATDLFGQLDREKLEQQGGGLGLAIAARYCEINDGHLDFETRAGGGVTVSINVPLVETKPA